MEIASATMPKEILYTESKELYNIALDLKKRYYNILSHVDVDLIFFAFVGGDYPTYFQYEIQGLKNEWVKHLSKNNKDTIKTYCIGMTYDFYQKSLGSQLQWIILDLLYSCTLEMNGKVKPKNVHEHSIILNTLEDLGVNYNWRNSYHLPELLGEETIMFGEDNEPLQ
jgi:hypothetical protein